MEMFWVWPDISLAIIAEYSKAVSITVVLGCFLSMAIFIIRLNIHGKVDVNPGMAIPGQAMHGVHNPFSIQLCTHHHSSLKDGVSLEMGCQAPCILYALWGVSIAALYPQIYLPWDVFRHQVITDTWLQNNITYRDKKIRLDICKNRRIKIEVPPKSVDLQLGELPRSKYPLVVVLLMDEEYSLEQNTCVVGHISVFHLQDEQCPGKSHIISEYIRTPLGQPYQLQQLYVTSVEDDTPSSPSPPEPEAPSSCSPTPDTSNPVNTSEPSGQCVVCQAESVNRALLPCRHACVCDSCFVHLFKCPMCRSPIESYFQMMPTVGDMWQDENETGQMQLPWWERWNNRLNTFLGFT